MKVLGCFQFYCCYIRNLNVIAKPLYDLIAEGTQFKWTEEHESVFQKIKDELCADTLLSMPDSRYPFHIHVDSSNVGTGFILIQEFPEGKRIVSYNSRIFDKSEQELSTTHRELCGIVSALQAYEHFIIGSPHPVYVYCDHKPILYLWARKGQLSHRFFRYQVIITKFQNLKIIWTPGKNLPIPDILSRNVTNNEQKKYQLTHKEIPKDIEFLDSLGNTVKYSIEHTDDPNATQNDFYPIICNYNGEKTRLFIKNNGDRITVENQPVTTECCQVDINVNFLDGKMINQRRNVRNKQMFIQTTNNIYETVDSDESEYRSDTDHDILMLEIQEMKEKENKQPTEDLICTVSQDHIAENAVKRLQNIAKKHDLNMQTINSEQKKDPVIIEVCKWVKDGTIPENTPKIRHSKALSAYRKQFNKLHLQDGTLCLDKIDTNNPNKATTVICLPMTLFLKSFQLAHEHPLAGHMGENKTMETIRSFFYWPGMYKWVHALIADCINCQSNKHKRHDINEAEVQKWSEKVPLPFHTVHIDHKGPLNPKSFGYQHCLVVVDAFSRFIQVYPVQSTTAADTVKAMERFITTFGIPQKLVYDRGTAFMNSDFTNWCKELGITMAPRTPYSPWTNGKVETQNKHLARYFRNFISENSNNWAKLAHQFAFAHNTTVSYTTGTSPYEIVFGAKPQIPLSLKLGLHRNREKLCSAAFCEGLQPHTHSEQFTTNEAVDRFLNTAIGKSMIERETNFKKIYCQTYAKSRETLEKSREYRNRYKLGRKLEIGQKVLLEDHSSVTGKSKKLCELRSGPYTITKVITEVNYEITLDNDPTTKRAAHRNHLIEYFPASKTLPPLVQEYADPTNMDNEFYKRIEKFATKRRHANT